MKTFLIGCAIIVFLSSSIFAGDCSIYGSVVDAETGEGLPSADVIVVGERTGASTDADGNFFIPKVKAGKHTIKVSMMGYEKKRVEISVTDKLELNVRLHPTVEVEQPIIVTASRMKQNLQDSPVTTTVVTSDAISDHTSVTPEELMHYVPGVTMNKNQVSLRNSSGYAYGAGSRVLIMVDGIPLLTGDSGEIKWDALPVDYAKQIEVVKNAGSAMYGSGALGGVINIITKEPDGDARYHLYGEIGAYDKPYYPQWEWTQKTLMFNKIGGEYSQRIGNLGFFAGVMQKHSDGYQESADFNRGKIFSKLIWYGNHTKQFTTLAEVAYEDHGAFFEWLDRAHALSIDSTKKEDRVWSTKVTVSSQYSKMDIENERSYELKGSVFLNTWSDRLRNDTGDFDKHHSNNVRASIDGQGNVKILGKQRLAFGGELSLEQVESSMFGNRIGAGGALFIQDEYDGIKNLLASVGTRIDYFSVDSASTFFQVNPKAGLVYHISNHIATRASFGTGYRIPAVAELFTSTSVAGIIEVKPNPQLAAETAYSSELGANYVRGKDIFDVALFYNYYDQLIEPRMITDYIAKFQNIDKARVSGIELSLQSRRGPFDISANYFYTKSVDITTGEKLPYRPDHNFSISGRFNYPRVVTWLADWRYKSAPTFSYHKDEQSVPQKVLDLGTSLDWKKYYIKLRVNNVFNYNYTEIEGNLGPIRHFILSGGVRL